MSIDYPVTYVLDANVFIEAHNRYYSLDLCPGFWNCLLHYNQEFRLVSIDKVKVELVRVNKNDSLKQWVERSAGDFFLSTANQEVVNHFRNMMRWVQNNPQFTPPAKAEFASVADGWLIAYAKSTGSLLVTHEMLNPDVRKRVPIPNVCKEFGVRWADTFDMLRSLEVKFGWDKNGSL